MTRYCQSRRVLCLSTVGAIHRSPRVEPLLAALAADKGRNPGWLAPPTIPSFPALRREGGIYRDNLPCAIET